MSRPQVICPEKFWPCDKCKHTDSVASHRWYTHTLQCWWTKGCCVGIPVSVTKCSQPTKHVFNTKASLRSPTVQFKPCSSSVLDGDDNIHLVYSAPKNENTYDAQLTKTVHWTEQCEDEEPTALMWTTSWMKNENAYILKWTFVDIKISNSCFLLPYVTTLILWSKQKFNLEPWVQFNKHQNLS